MKNFLRRFAAVVWGVLSGFDRVVFKGRLPQSYSPEGMNCYASANPVRLLDFTAHAKEVTRQVLAASQVASAKAADRVQYLGSGRASKTVRRWATRKGRRLGGCCVGAWRTRTGGRR